MQVLIGFLYVLEIVVCLLLALIVMMQKPKEGGLGGAFGGGALEASLGADAGNILLKGTIILGSIFLINTLLLACLTSTSKKESVLADRAVAPVEQAPITLNMDAEAPAEAPVESAAQTPAEPTAPETNTGS